MILIKNFRWQENTKLRKRKLNCDFYFTINLYSTVNQDLGLALVFADGLHNNFYGKFVTFDYGLH